jgi:hypothetical protein
MNEHRGRAERAFDRALAKGRYADGVAVKESDRTGFIRGWNMAHKKFSEAKRLRRA